MSSGGKGGGGSGLRDYYGTFGGVVSPLQVDFLVALNVDGKVVWEPATPVSRLTSSNPYQFDVSGYGRCYFYWGTADQTFQAAHARVLMQDGHPPYRSRSYLLCVDFLCGRERTSVPNIEVVVRRQPVQSVITGTALDSAGQVNPIPALMEVFTNALLGSGRSPEDVDQESLQALADELATDTTAHYLTLSAIGEATPRSILASLLDHIDGWARINAQGKLELGRFADGGNEPEDLPIITADDLEEEPEVETIGLDEAPDIILVNYKDRALEWEKTTARADNQFLRRYRQGRSITERAERPFIRRAAQAQTAVDHLDRIFGQRYHRGTFTIRSAKAEGLFPGDQFRFVLTEPIEINEVCRVKGRAGDALDNETVEIEWETERGLQRTGYSAPAEQVLPGGVYAVRDPRYWQPVLLPSALTDGVYQITALVGQDLGLTTSARLWLQVESEEEYYSLGILPSFAVPAKFAAEYLDTEPTDDETGALTISQMSPAAKGWSDIPIPQSSEGINDDALLMFAFQASDPSQFEIFTVKDIGSPTDGVYPVHVLRARFGTSALSFAADDPVYIIERNRLRAFTHRQLASVADGATTEDRTVSLKAQTLSAFGSLDLADATAKTLEITPQSLPFQGEQEPFILDGNGELEASIP